MSRLQERRRRIYLDFQTLPDVPDVGVNFDAEAVVATLKSAHVQVVHFYARDMYGHSYYETHRGAEHPHLRKDMLQEMTDVCRRSDIRVIAYFGILFDDRVAKAHPDWRAVDAEGRPYTAWTIDPLCVNSPYLQECVLPELQELVERYDIDGIFLDPIAHYIEQRWCYCPCCRAKFKERFGEEIPRNRESPLGFRCAAWRREIFNDFRRKCCEAAHRSKPHLLITINNTFCGTYYPSDPPDYVDFLNKEVKTETSRHVGAGYFGRYLATLDKPFQLLGDRFMNSWLDWDLKPTAMLQYESAAMITTGATCCFVDKLYADGTLEEEFYRSLRETYEFVKEREQFCLKAKPVPYIAVLQSETTRKYSNNDLSPDLAAHEALVQSSLHFNIINEDTLMRSLDAYKTLVLPEQTNLSERVVRIIEAFVKRGGGLVASGSTSLGTETGERRGDFGLGEVFGVKYRAEYPHPHAYFKLTDESIAGDIHGLPMHIDGDFVYVEPTSAQTLANLVDCAYIEEIPGRFSIGSAAPPGENSGYPAVTLNRFGRGNVAYISGSIFRSYWEKNRSQTKYLIRNLVRLVTTEKLLEVEASAAVEVSLFEQNSRLVLHLLFGQIEKVFDGPRAAVMEKIPPIRNVSVKLKVAGEPERVVQIPEERDLAWELKDGCLSFRVPEFRIHSCVVVSGARRKNAVLLPS